MNPLLLPVPFALVMLYALLVPNGRNRHVGYVGSLAGIATLVLLWLSEKSGSVPWFSAGGFSFSLSAFLDPVSATFAAVTAAIGVFVFLYSVGYFEKKEDLRRYYALLALFAWSMVGVVISGNLLQLFFCWELVGVSSFLLIGFWHEKESAVKAAGKAFLTIITGDAFFLMGVLTLALHYGTLDIQAILAALQADGLTVLAGVGIIGGIVSKSAQFPLHGWLADAMAGPTPVSAFLHSATMVKAGLFLAARFLPLLVLAGLDRWLLLIAVVTILLSGCAALVETDIKRVLAYSTMNQLGFILMGLTLAATAASMYHLVTHSVFKALLFFAAGVAIHTAGTQDLTKIRLRLEWRLFPIAALIGAAALAGVPLLSGFFSKEGLLEAVIHSGSGELMLVVGIAVVMSAAYIFRWFFLIFSRNGKRAHAPWQMRFPLPVLGLLALAGGGFAGMFYAAWGAHAPNVVTSTSLASVSLVGLGILAAWTVAKRDRLRWLSRSRFADAARHGFLVDDVYALAARTVRGLANAASVVENHVVHRSARFVPSVFLDISAFARRMQTGHASTYIAAFVLGFLLIAVSLGVLA